MADATSEFFHKLGRHGHERLPGTTSGSIRFDLEHDNEIDTWLVTIDKGQVRVSRQAREADAVIRTDRGFFGRMIRGEVRPVAAWLRNEMTSDGQFRFVVLLERLFPRSPGGRHPRAVAPAGVRQR